jgi:hypothetical protein
LYTYYYDGNNYSWVQLWIAMLSTSDTPAIVTFR